MSAAQLGAIVDLIGEGTISGKIAKDLFEIVWQEGGDPRALVEARGMKQVTDLGAIEKVVDDIIAANPDKVAQARAKPQLIGWFVGQVMKSSGGKANPQAGQRSPEVQTRHLNIARDGAAHDRRGADRMSSSGLARVDQHAIIVPAANRVLANRLVAIRSKNRFWRAPMRR